MNTKKTLGFIGLAILIIGTIVLLERGGILGKRPIGQHTGRLEKYLCPRCREGHLRRIRGKNGAFWGCSNYPRCTATFDDSHDKPLLT